MNCYTVLFFLTFLTVTWADQIKLHAHPLLDEAGNRILWFNTSNYAPWTQRLDTFLEVYRKRDQTEGKSNKPVKCNYNAEPSDDSVCQINIEDYEPCVSSNHYGYKMGNPCIFFEIEKIFNWKPKYYNSSKYLPKGMPQQLKDKIEELTVDPNMWQTVWLFCEGETPADKENIGPLSFIPNPGFPGYFFPYKEQRGYLNPLVAMHLQKPMIGLVISIECKLWGPGISHNYNKEFGLIRFEILVDK